MDDHDGRHAAARADFEAALRRIRAEISAEPDDDAAYRLASWLTETLRQATFAAAEARAVIVARIRDAGGLSLAKLGDRIGVSKARAAEMMQAERRRKTR